MNLRGKRRVIPHGEPEIWYHLMKSRPDLPRGKGTFDWWRSRRWWSGFKSARFEPCNCYTTALLVINQAQLDWSCQEGFSCKRIEEHMQEDVNTQSDNCKHGWNKDKYGVQSLGSKGLIDTDEEIMNGGPGSLKRICCHSCNESISVSRGKLEINKTQTLMYEGWGHA